MGKLLDLYNNAANVTSGTSVMVPIAFTDRNRVWILEQISAFYSVATDSPTVSILLNGVLYSGPAPMVPTGTGLGQTFGGQPYLYIESDDRVQILFQGCTVGATASIQVQQKIVPYDHSDLDGRFG